jgi:hypothetical protein
MSNSPGVLLNKKNQALLRILFGIKKPIKLEERTLVYNSSKNQKDPLKLIINFSENSEDGDCEVIFTTEQYTSTNSGYQIVTNECSLFFMHKSPADLHMEYVVIKTLAIIFDDLFKNAKIHDIEMALCALFNLQELYEILQLMQQTRKNKYKFHDGYLIDITDISKQIKDSIIQFFNNVGTEALIREIKESLQRNHDKSMMDLKKILLLIVITLAIAAAPHVIAGTILNMSTTIITLFFALPITMMGAMFLFDDSDVVNELKTWFKNRNALQISTEIKGIPEEKIREAEIEELIKKAIDMKEQRNIIFSRILKENANKAEESNHPRLAITLPPLETGKPMP